MWAYLGVGRVRCCNQWLPVIAEGETWIGNNEQSGLFLLILRFGPMVSIEKSCEPTND